MPQYTSYNALGSTIENDETNFSGLFLISSQTLVSAATEIDFASLDQDEDTRYLLIVEGEGVNASSIGITLNGDDVATNYYAQKVSWNNATISSTRGNSYWTINGIGIDLGFMLKSIISRDSKGFGRALTEMSLNNDVILEKSALRTDAAITKITNITLLASVAGSFKAGTKASLFKIKEI